MNSEVKSYKISVVNAAFSTMYKQEKCIIKANGNGDERNEVSILIVKTYTKIRKSRD